MQALAAEWPGWHVYNEGFSPLTPSAYFQIISWHQLIESAFDYAKQTPRLRRAILLRQRKENLKTDCPVPFVLKPDSP